MEYRGTVTQVKTLLRALHGAISDLKKEVPNKKYMLHFALGLATPELDKTDSEVLSRISQVSDVLSKLSSQDLIHIKIDVSEFGGIGDQIGIKTKEKFEAAKALEENAQEGKELAKEAAIQALRGK